VALLHAQAPAPAEPARIAQHMRFAYRFQPDGSCQFLAALEPDGTLRDVTKDLFGQKVTGQLPPIVNDPGVRRALVLKMREAARKVIEDGARGVILEGRDIGTVVFPDATVKFFFTANLDVRTKRRTDELRAKGETVDEQCMRQALDERDRRDERRTIGPLRRAEDALPIDNSNLNLTETVDRLQTELHRKIGGNERT